MADRPLAPLSESRRCSRLRVPAFIQDGAFKDGWPLPPFSKIADTDAEYMHATFLVGVWEVNEKARQELDYGECLLP